MFSLILSLFFKNKTKIELETDQEPISNTHDLPEGKPQILKINYVGYSHLLQALGMIYMFWLN